MTDKPNLRNELLRQNGASAATDAKMRHKILATDQARVRRMRWMVGMSWAIFLVFFLLAALLEYGQRHALPFLGCRTGEFMVYFPEYRWLVPMAIIVAQGWFVLAVILTFSLHVRSRTMSMHQIQATLAGIEEQLRKMAEKQP